jgi:hypothetical protein
MKTSNRIIRGAGRSCSVALGLAVMFLMTVFHAPTPAHAIDELFAELQNLDTPPVNNFYGAADMDGYGDVDIVAMDEQSNFVI